MSFQVPITISEAIRNIENNNYLLPSIQREFEWGHEKIEWLFDSIMRNYPISSFLFWRVEKETKNQFRFYQFLKCYKQKYSTHNQEFNTNTHNDFIAILDGQQRLTSLYIGLRGSFAYRVPRLREENSERVYPTRYLYLNIEQPLNNEEDGRIYEFKFLTNEEFERNQASWFNVSTIYALSDDFVFNQYLDKHKLKENEFTYRSLSTLKNVIHSKPIINFFLETEQDIDKALNIFIRINSGGEPLSFSDLLMSIAVANWQEKDARKEIHQLVDNVRDKGFTISKDFVLRSFLYLYSKDIKFKVTNFSRDNARHFESKWEGIRDSILSVFDLVRSFGFSDYTLTSKNSLLPIIYYVYHKGIYKNFHNLSVYSKERDTIKKWVHIVLVKKVFSATSDSVLSQIRKAFTNDVTLEPLNLNFDNFPSLAINMEIRRDMSISDDFINELLLTQKDDKYAFSILALLYPALDYRNNDFHKDHLHAESKYDNLSEDDKNKYGWVYYNSILNLQMLGSNENMSKQDMDLSCWVTEQAQGRDKSEFLNNHLIPDVSLSLVDFSEFIEHRRTLLLDKLKTVLG